MTWETDLDAMLYEFGESVTLRRIVGRTNPTNVDCDIRAFVRGYDPAQLAGTIMQGDSMVIISANDIDDAQWPGGQPTPEGATNTRVPRIADQVIIRGRIRSVVATEPVYVAGDLLRVNLQVRG